MDARDFPVGKLFKHNNHGLIVVINEDNVNYFKNTNGDLFEYIDECLLKEISFNTEEG